MSEKATVHYLKWDTLYDRERPFQIFMSLSPTAQDLRKTNLMFEEKQIGVGNLRGREEDFDVDSHGFAVRMLPGFAELTDEKTIKEKYIPSVQSMIQRQLQDAGTVFVYDWRLRSSGARTTSGAINFSDQTLPLLPSNFAHIDLCPISIIRRIQSSFPDDADRILQQRVRAVNVWKPLFHAVEEWPLAVCDGTTVQHDDLIETDSVRQGSISTNYYAKYNQQHAWYFLQNQTPDEALLFKHFDSAPGVAPYALHSSVKCQISAPEPRPRQSIEVRTLVFSEMVDADAGL